MNKHHQVALAAANRWAEGRSPNYGRDHAIQYGIEFATVYNAALIELRLRENSTTIWQKLGFA